MSEKGKSFLIPLVIGAVIAALVCFFGDRAGRSIPHLLCDGFFVAGVLLTGSGGLAFVKNQGMFDIMSFGIKSVFHIHWPWLGPRTPEEGKETFVEYKERKREERKSPVWTLLAGAVYLALALVMMVVYLCT